MRESKQRSEINLSGSKSCVFPLNELNFYSLVGSFTWLVMSDGMGDGGLECVLASWETKPESWEETLLSRWAPAEGICRRLPGRRYVSGDPPRQEINVCGNIRQRVITLAGL